jgi:predicted CXXCH cytochrome family protein
LYIYLKNIREGGVLLRKGCNKKNSGRKDIGAALVLLSLFFLFTPCSSATGGETCLDCHEELSKGKAVHQAVSMGCTTCHSAIDTSDIPHKVTGKLAKGLSADQPELCYGCHDKTAFSKKNLHAAVSMGCTGCHNPHSSKNARLLVSEPPGLCFNCHEKKKFEGKVTHSPVAAGMCTSCHTPHSGAEEKLLIADLPELCFNCHDKGAFSKKNVHPPVAGGMCLSCHGPHATEAPVLLSKGLNGLCLGCHKGQATGKHVLAGFGGFHPLEGKSDPSSPDKKMTCVSCHNAHSSDVAKLFQSPGICKRCHKY